jgi:hypothetical protein
MAPTRKSIARQALSAQRCKKRPANRSVRITAKKSTHRALFRADPDFVQHRLGTDAARVPAAAEQVRLGPGAGGDHAANAAADEVRAHDDRGGDGEEERESDCAKCGVSGSRRRGWEREKGRASLE